MSLLGKLKAAKAELEMPADPWLAPLQRVRGKVEFDGHERVSSQTLLDMLEVPQRGRTAGTFRRVAKLMAALDGRLCACATSPAAGIESKFAGMFAGLRMPERCVKSPQRASA